MSDRQVFEQYFMQNTEAREVVLGQVVTQQGTELVADVETFITRYVVLPDAARLPLALWSIATHVFASFDCFPYLALLSPVKRSGKTRCLEVLELLCCHPRRITAPTEAALFRMIQNMKPTLLLDEMESLTQKDSERARWINGLLNAGHRQGATVPRCEGNSHQLVEFSVFCPKALAAIRKLPDTILDRAVVVWMQRRKANEKVGRFRFSRAKAEAGEILKKLQSVLEDIRPHIAQAYLESPDLAFLSDRDEECYAGLFSLCSLLAPTRLPSLKRDALKLTESKAGDDIDDSLSLRLLSDVKSVWPDGQGGTLTRDLLQRLREIEDAPWAEERALNPRKLARILRPFRIFPREVRIGEIHGKGYLRDEFEAVWGRYLA